MALGTSPAGSLGQTWDIWLRNGVVAKHVSSDQGTVIKALLVDSNMAQFTDRAPFLHFFLIIQAT